MSELVDLLGEESPPADPIWVASSCILLRSIGGFRFPHKMDEVELSQFNSLIKQSFQDLSLLDKPSIFSGEKISPLEREYLFEHFWFLEGFEEGRERQTFVLDHSHQFLGMANVRDHLHLQVIDFQPSFDHCYAKVMNIENELGKKLEYAFRPDFGFLTAQPQFSGTGLLVFAYLHVPALAQSGQLSSIVSECAQEDAVVLSLQGGVEDLLGDLLVIRNRYTVGFNEEAIMRNMHLIATKISLAERTLRETLKKEPNSTLRDQISRSLGLITHSMQLQTPEALNSLSLLKLGIELGWLEGDNRTHLDRLFSTCRRAHLTEASSVTDPEELSKKRAELLREELQQLKLSA